ncbi:MAG: hypothetical protein ACKO34_06310 [Vampirovibrionales bacterium]
MLLLDPSNGKVGYSHGSNVDDAYTLSDKYRFKHIVNTFTLGNPARLDDDGFSNQLRFPSSFGLKEGSVQYIQSSLPLGTVQTVCPSLVAQGVDKEAMVYYSFKRIVGQESSSLQPCLATENPGDSSRTDCTDVLMSSLPEEHPVKKLMTHLQSECERVTAEQGPKKPSSPEARRNWDPNPSQLSSFQNRPTTPIDTDNEAESRPPVSLKPRVINRFKSTMKAFLNFWKRVFAEGSP